MKRTRWLRKKSKRLGAEFERKLVEKSPEDRLQVNSGANPAKPGDIWNPEWLKEAKESGTLSARGRTQITIKREWLEKARQEAFYLKRKFMLLFRFADDDKEYVILDYNDLLELIELARRGEGS